jgi:CTP synthase
MEEPYDCVCLVWALLISHDRLFDSVSIVLVGKYTNLQDSYISVIKSLEHSSLRCNRKLDLHWVDASDLECDTLNSSPVKYHTAWKVVCSAEYFPTPLPISKDSGILLPGGFGIRGIEGMISAAKWAREQKIPYLGICLGLQIAAIEFARNVVGLPGTHLKSEANVDAHSTESVDNCKEPVVIFMPEGSKTHLGGTMRLGLRPTIFQPHTEWSLLRRLYGGEAEVHERHRHRYEINPDYISCLEEKGLFFVGRDDKGERMEILELPTQSPSGGPTHPYFVGVQFHPELKRSP